MAVYSLVGVFIGVAATLVILHYKKADLPLGKFVGVCVLWIVGLLAVGFGVDWAYASTLEVETQSSAMGLLFFGGFGVILGIIGFRLGAPKAAKDSTEA